MLRARARSWASARPLVVPALLLLTTACGGSGQAPPDARAELRQAKATVDATTALHFTLSTTGAPASGAGTFVTGGQGDAHRPNAVAGRLQVSLGGLPVAIDVVSAGGTFYAKLPFQGGYIPTDPTKYGFGDPGRLLDPQAGLSSLLSDATAAVVDGRDRLNGEELEEVAVTLPGRPVAALLTSADPSQPVHGRIGIVPSSHQVRRVALTGPFFDAHQPSTFTLILTMYGETVQITPPPAR